MLTLLAKKRIWLTALLLIFTGILIYIYQSDTLVKEVLFHLRESLDTGEELRREFLSYGVWAPVLFILLQVLQVLFAPIPGEASGILGGYLFGTWLGFIYSSIGLTLGSLIAFIFGRLLGEVFINRFFRTRTYQKFNDLVRKKDFVIPFVLFIVPGFPKDMLSYVLGLSTIPLPVFLFVAAIGRMPGTLMLSMQGDHVYEGNFLQLVILSALSVAVFLPCWLGRRKLLKMLARRNKTIK